jgi:hypothetical protein
MPLPSTIRYVKRGDIDTQRWDRCIDHSDNGLIYAYSFYLDQMADNWDGLVFGGYEAVMPLPWRKKMGFYYLYQPFLCAQEGLFGNALTAEQLQEFLRSVPTQFRLWEFSLNHKNLFSVPGFHLYERSNYILNLAKPYETLYNNYRENTRRNIKKSEHYGCYAKTGIDPDAVIELAKQQGEPVPAQALQNFVSVYRQLAGRGKASSYGVFSNRDELIASCIFIFSHKRAYYILVGNHPNGRTLGASHALIDAFIKDHAGKDLWLDFEGSDMRNLAFFYSGFGATEEKYPAVKLNRLPWYVKWWKK